ncbi:MAG: hypothetical protein CMJ70_06015 [Planctomycetaceae bacterium]|nr:hypothetical protein [Planctomycetaceae bacterium]HAA69564.1 hypothetical protein [Planctomycetaceae bacterium]
MSLQTRPSFYFGVKQLADLHRKQLKTGDEQATTFAFTRIGAAARGHPCTIARFRQSAQAATKTMRVLQDKSSVEPSKA